MGRTINGDRPYRLRVKTSDFHGAGTDSTIHARMHNKQTGSTIWTELDTWGNDTERGDDDIYGLQADANWGPPCSVELKTSGSDAWCIEKVEVHGPNGEVWRTRDDSGSSFDSGGTPRWLSTDPNESDLKMVPLSVGSARFGLYDKDGISACATAEERKTLLAQIREMEKKAGKKVKDAMEALTGKG